MTWTPNLFDEPTARSTVTVEVGRHSACWVHGYGLHRYLVELDCPRMFCPIHHCLTLPINRVGDLLALLELRDHRIVELSPVDR